MDRTKTDECLKLALEGWRKPALEDRYGVSHSVVERVGMAASYAWSGLDVLAWDGGKEAVKLIRQHGACFGGAGISWGQVATSFGPRSVDEGEPRYSEPMVRKAWRELTGTSDKGMRIAGKGGAWWKGEARLYEGVLTKTGVVGVTLDEAATHDGRMAAAERAVLMTQSLAELRALADELGVSHAKLSKAQLAADLVERVAAD